MSPREHLLVAVLSSRTAKGPIVVLQGPNGETAERLKIASAHPRARLSHGANTWEEARNAMAWAIDGHLTITTSAYHQLRAFLTFLKALQVSQLDRSVKLWNLCAPSDCYALEREFEKIEMYRAQGHVATYEDGIAYLQWRGR